MIEERIEAKTEEGTVDGKLLLPEGAGPWPLAVFYMDAAGLRPAMTEMGKRLVDAGYAVLQPNLYWRAGDFAPFDTSTVFGDEKERTRLMGLARAVKANEAVSDTEALLGVLENDARVKSDRFGAVGYCLGGRTAFIVATALGERVAAAASIHGGNLVTDGEDSPHRAASKIRGAIYLGVADEDRSCTPEHQEALREALDAAGVRYQLELYPGARHGFAVVDFPVYDEAAAEKHWERVLSLFGETLR